MVQISEILANPAGADRGREWVELCADSGGGALSGLSLLVGKRTLPLSGYLNPGECALAETGTAAVRNQFADVSLGAQRVRTAGSAPEEQGFHVLPGGESFWASSTPGLPAPPPPSLPPLPNLGRGAPWDLLGTAACTAGILTALALAALRHARNRNHTLRG